MKFSDLKLSTPYLKLPDSLYSRVEQTPLKNPYIISTSQNAAALLGVDEDLSRDAQLLKILNGEKILEGSKPFAMAYGGHQFGSFVPRLGDGRVVNLGKVNGQNLQLKGAGLTPYSRQGDGRAVLRSSLREYLASEAMYGLGIATSRALALVGSQSDVARQVWEKGALVLRLSPTWVRFGTFEYLNAAGEYRAIQELADYVIAESFSHLAQTQDLYIQMYKEIVIATATTIAQWQSVGFVHGVMNTDNMAIDGRSIDYGPFAFLDNYEKYFVCNKTDSQGRYSFSSQSGAAYWSLDMLSRALAPIVERAVSEDILEEYFTQTFERMYGELMRMKLGLESEHEDDRLLIASLLRSLESAHIDYTAFFRALSRFDGDKEALLALAETKEPLVRWLEDYECRLTLESLSSKERHTKMCRTNPKYILKNHILQNAITKVDQGDFTMLEHLLEVALAPFDEHPELEYLIEPAPAEMRNKKLSCSS